MKRIAMSAVAAVAVAVSLTSCVRMVQNEARDDYTVEDRIGTVRVQNGAGDVNVRHAEGVSAIEVHRLLQYPKGGDKPGATHRVEGDTLVLDGCGSNCSADYEVVLPDREARVVGDNGSGDVRVEGVAAVELTTGSGNTTLRTVTGAVRLENASGDVEVSDVGGDFTGRMGSGRTRLSGMRGAVVLENDSGDTEVAMAEARPVRAEGGSGNLTVRVPQGTYRVEADAGSGDEHIGVTSDPNATVELVLRTRSGDLTVQSAA
ncbi:DUF4097 family beta strand repeat-containing protein [Saccharothrix coeruleofusca]|uniref:DUF4097 family beta strand repeat-containing protein n=1 Tax=Saccharothrix coeruleofusca TaxID=33919 RepID=UPI0016711806|nr:DUF4097 family beta strand repeat-containing protein [Saccharothrix coeruleofusca]MBP2339780.1 hypothetical protein [Saccharothrix coeruleofusca]